MHSVQAGRADQLEGISAEKNLGVLVDSSAMSQQCVLANRLREVILPLCS